MFVEKKGKFIKQIVSELELGFMESLASLIAEFNNKDFPSPLLSGSLPAGERIQFVMSPGCESEKVICSIRRQQMRDMTLNDYVSAGAFDDVITSSISSNVDDELKALYHEKNILKFLQLAVAG